MSTTVQGSLNAPAPPVHHTHGLPEGDLSSKSEPCTYQRLLIGRLRSLHGDPLDDKINWVVTTSGPIQRPTYTSLFYLDGTEIGRGSGPTRNAAKESAAARTLARLPRPALTTMPANGWRERRKGMFYSAQAGATRTVIGGNAVLAQSVDQINLSPGSVSARQPTPMRTWQPGRMQMVRAGAPREKKGEETVHARSANQYNPASTSAHSTTEISPEGRNIDQRAQYIRAEAMRRLDERRSSLLPGSPAETSDVL